MGSLHVSHWAEIGTPFSCLVPAAISLYSIKHSTATCLQTESTATMSYCGLSPLFIWGVSNALITPTSLRPPSTAVCSRTSVSCFASMRPPSLPEQADQSGCRRAGSPGPRVMRCGFQILILLTLGP